MRRKLALILLPFALLLFLTSCEREWVGDIRGQVTDTETEEGIQDALVVAGSEKNDYSISTRTDSEGNYVINEARWGPNSVFVYHPNYEAQTRYADVIRDEAVTLDFELTRIPDSVEPVLTVRVRNTNGDPIENARIDLYREEDPIDDEYLYIATSETDSAGIAFFQLTAVYENEIVAYQLRIVAFGYQDQTKNIFVTWLEDEPEVDVTMEFAE